MEETFGVLHALILVLAIFFQEAGAAPPVSGVPVETVVPFVHIVDDDAHTLVEISVLLYGNPEEWTRLAQLNQLKGSRSVTLGQTVVLHRSPTLSRPQGREALLNYWRKRLKGEGFAPLTAPATPASSFSVVLSPQEVKVQAEKSQTPGESALIDATRELESSSTEMALEKARAARKADPRFLAHWFVELRCLSLLKKDGELNALLKDFMREFPHLTDLPVIRGYLAKKEAKP